SGLLNCLARSTDPRALLLRVDRLRCRPNALNIFPAQRPHCVALEVVPGTPRSTWFFQYRVLRQRRTIDPGPPPLGRSTLVVAIAPVLSRQSAAWFFRSLNPWWRGSVRTQTQKGSLRLPLRSDVCGAASPASAEL